MMSEHNCKHDSQGVGASEVWAISKIRSFTRDSGWGPPAPVWTSMGFNGPRMGRSQVFWLDLVDIAAIG